MKYYFIIENNAILCGTTCCSDSDNSIEVSEEIYNAWRADSDLYIWDGSNIVENPKYPEIKLEQEKQRRNLEIDSKIKELNEMAIPDILHGNKENIELYNEVIAGLEAARP